MATIDMVVETAVREKTIDMKEFSTGNPELYAFYNGDNCPRNHIINLANIESEADRRFITEMIRAKVKTMFARPKSFQQLFFIPLKKILSIYKNDGLEKHILSYYSVSTYRNVAQFIGTFVKMKTVGTSVLVDHKLYLNNAPIAKERTTRRIKTISFGKVINPVNQKVLEDYALALLYQTDYSISTIFGNINRLIKLMNCHEPDCLHWSDNDIRTCFKDILSQKNNDNYKKNDIRIIVDLFDYLAEAKLLPYSRAGIYAQDISIRHNKRYIKTAPDEYVLLQIFNCLPKASTLVRLAFLILYCTGMRISELVSLKRSCLEWQGDYTYIHYYQHKMRKDVCNAIPHALAEMISTYVNNTPVDKHNDYLFISREGKPFITSSIVKKINNFFHDMHICNKDGTLYKFSPHSYRHLMAKRMRQHNIPIRFIQEQLHHANQNMTLFYVEHFDEERIKEISEWFSEHAVTPVTRDLKLEIDRKKLVTYAILPNGLCTRLPVLGSCKSSCNDCIDCQFFKTSTEWEPALLEQRDRLERFIEHAKNQGWTKAVKNNERTLDRLTNIIEDIRRNSHHD